jgi:hypothetical protein
MCEGELEAEKALEDLIQENDNLQFNRSTREKPIAKKGPGPLSVL